MDMIRITRLARLHTFKAGEVIGRESSAGDEICAIVSGHVKVLLQLPDGGTEHVATLNPGESFGEALLVGKRQRMASAVAEDPVEIFVWKNADLLGHFTDFPEVGYIVMKNLAKIQTERVSFLLKEVRQFAEGKKEMKKVLSSFS